MFFIILIKGIVSQMETNTFCGSMAYLAPEMIKGKGHNKSIDWYHLGVLLYEILSGHSPYNGNNL